MHGSVAQVAISSAMIRFRAHWAGAQGSPKFASTGGVARAGVTRVKACASITGRAMFARDEFEGSVVTAGIGEYVVALAISECVEQHLREVYEARKEHLRYLRRWRIEGGGLHVRGVGRIRHGCCGSGESIEVWLRAMRMRMMRRSRAGRERMEAVIICKTLLCNGKSANDKAFKSSFVRDNSLVTIVCIVLPRSKVEQTLYIETSAVQRNLNVIVQVF